MYINLISLPILIHWGLPVSLLSPVGNLIFSPIMTLFMFVSCIIFFTELIGIPNLFFIKVLELLTRVWQYALNFGNNKFFVYFSAPPIIFLVFLILLIIFIVWHKKASGFKRMLLFISIFCVSYSVVNLFLISKNFSLELCAGKSKAELFKFSGKVYLNGSKILGKAKGFNSFIDYTLLPTLIKNSGSNKIDYLIVDRISDKNFKNLQYLLGKVRVESIFIELGAQEDVNLIFNGSLNANLKLVFTNRNRYKTFFDKNLISDKFNKSLK